MTFWASGCIGLAKRVAIVVEGSADVMSKDVRNVDDVSVWLGTTCKTLWMSYSVLSQVLKGSVVGDG